MVMLINTIFQIVMHRDTLNTKYDADAQVKQLVRSMGKCFQKLSVNKKFFHWKTLANPQNKHGTAKA